MSARYLGGIVSKDPLTLNPAAGNAANGVFTLEQYMQAVKNATWPGFDPYFNQTVLSLHGNGTNGAQNNTFLDGSTNNFTITRNGNTTQGTFSPFSLAAGEWSNFFDGTGDYLSVADNAAFDLAASDFTFECWVYTTAYNSQYNCLISQWDTSLAYRFFFTSTTTTFGYYSGSSQTLEVTGQTNNLNEWIHFCVTRSGNTLTIYKNGTSIGTKDITGVTINNASVPLWISGLGTGSGSINNTTTHFGYISNLRLVKGTATAPPAGGPTSPLTNVTNTSLLTCQSNRFVDNGTANSGTGFTITRNGDVRVTPFSPFAPSAAYSAGTNGGSGYFDGNGDFLSLPSNSAFDLGSSSFTVEAWVYPLATVSTTQMIMGCWEGASSYSWALMLGATNTVGFSYSTTGVYQAANDKFYAALQGKIRPSAWNHIAVTRSGSSFTMYLNGVSESTFTSSDTFFNSQSTMKIGNNTFNNQVFFGYIANARLIKGSAVAPPAGAPTSPLTAVTNTVLLCNFTNAGILDHTGKNVLETVADAQIDTTTKKFGTGSLEFDGTGDALLLPSSENLILNGNFTIEGWLYLTSGTTYYTILATSAWAANNGGLLLLQSHPSYTGKLSLWLANNASGASPLLVGATSLSATTWTHFAVTRSGNDFKLFVNGVQDASASSSAAISLAITQIATLNSSNNFNGYIDDLRITKGVARYTANFTPQTSQWQDQ